MLTYHMKRLAALFIPDSLYAKLTYLKNHRRMPRTPPVNFNEYLCSLKATGELARYRRYADKLAARDFVAEKVGSRYLVPLHATAKRLTRDVWDRLPQSFVVKANHGSGWNRIVRNKDTGDFASTARLANAWTRQNFYYVRREQQYRDIAPELMFETLLAGEGQALPAEYKFFCFHGKIAYALAILPGPGGARGCFDRDWHRLDVMGASPHVAAIPRPRQLGEMVAVAETLALAFPFVRVDLYVSGGRVYFSELTFVPGGGGWVYTPESFAEVLGRLWKGEDADLARFRFGRRLAPLPAAQAGHAKAGIASPPRVATRAAR